MYNDSDIFRDLCLCFRVMKGAPKFLFDPQTVLGVLVDSHARTIALQTNGFSVKRVK